MIRISWKTGAENPPCVAEIFSKRENNRHRFERGDTMRKFGSICRLTAYGLAFYYTIAVVLRVGIVELVRWAYPSAEEIIVLNWIIGGILKLQPATIQIVLTLVIMSISWDWGSFMQILFDILIGWLVMTVWRILAIPVPEFLQSILCDVTLSIFISSIFAVLVEAKLKSSSKGGPKVPSPEE